MKEIRIKVKFLDSGEVYEENMGVPEDAEPLQYVKEAIQYFNNNRYANESPREFVEVIGETGINYCNVYKVNSMTVSRGRSFYDVWRCEVCRLFYQRFGLSGRPPSIMCTPKQVCLDCNKVFKTEKALVKHKEKNRHKPPAWLPDGV